MMRGKSFSATCYSDSHFYFGLSYFSTKVKQTVQMIVFTSSNTLIAKLFYAITLHYTGDFNEAAEILWRQKCSINKCGGKTAFSKNDNKSTFFNKQAQDLIQ